MGMVVRTNSMAINANRQLTMNNSSVSKSLEKLSSGFRINRAGDDASGLAVSEKMKAQIKGLDTASMNAQDGISLIQTAEGALTEVHDMLNRIKELSTKSANGIYSAAGDPGNAVAFPGVDRGAIQDEVAQLTQEISRISVTTTFNGLKLLDGTGAFDLQIGDTGVGDNMLNVSISTMDVETMWSDLQDTELGKLYGGAVTGDLINYTVNGAVVTTMDVTTQLNAQKSIDDVEKVINYVSKQRGALGAAQNRLEHTINNLEVASENINAANSRIRDTDMAKTMMEYTKMNVLTQSAQAMLAQANQQPQSVLQLLQ